MKSKTSKFVFGGVAAVMAVTTLIGSFAPGQGAGPSNAGTPAQIVTSELAQDAKPIPDVFLGAENAPVTIVEYGSFTCVHCGNFATNVFPDLKAEFIDTGKVKFAMREAYTDKYGLWAGLLAYEISEGRTDPVAYYDFVDAVFEKQADWAFGSRDAVDMTNKLRAIAYEQGMTQDEADAILADGAKAEHLVATYVNHNLEDNIEGTPTFFINGVKHYNMPLDDFRRVIEAEIRKSE